VRDTEETIGGLIDGASVSIVGSVDPDGFPNSKAMLPPRRRQGIKHIFLTTNTSSMRVRQYSDDPKACVYFFDGPSFRGVMLRGVMDVLHDQASKDSIWRPGDEMYYPGGATDPDYCVLRFTAQDGRYYAEFRSEGFEIE
jgi:general stress protein 26